MRKCLAIVFVLVMVLAFAGCSKDEKDSAYECFPIEAQHNLAAADSLDKLILDQNTSAGKTIEITDDKPYWGILIENKGSHIIKVDMGLDNQILRVEPNEKVWVYNKSLFGKGSYEICFSCNNTEGMRGFAELFCSKKEKAIACE